MGRRQEPALKRRRRQVDTAPEHLVKESFKERLVGTAGRLKIGDHLVGKEEADHRSGPVDPVADAMPVENRDESAFQMFGRCLQIYIELGMAIQYGELSKTGVHGDRIPGECTGLVDGPIRRDDRHDLFFPAECANRKAAADDLAEGYQIRPDIIFLLGTSP